LSSSGSAVGVIALVGGILTAFFLLRTLATNKEPSVAVAAPAATITGQGSWFGKWWLVSMHGPGWCPVRLDLFDAGVRIGPSAKCWAWFVPTTDLRWSDIKFVTKEDWRLSFVGRNSSTKGFVRFYVPVGSRSDLRFQLLGVLASTMAFHGVRVTEKGG
jgi:hypothetical protein